MDTLRQRPMRLLALAVAFLGLTGPAVLVGQGGGSKCFAAGEGEAKIFAETQQLATDPAQIFADERATYGLSQVTLDDVHIVTNKSICQDASQAFKAVTGENGSSPKVWVFTVGDDFIVIEPTPQPLAGGRVRWMVFDGNFNLKGAFVA